MGGDARAGSGRFQTTRPPPCPGRPRLLSPPGLPPTDVLKHTPSAPPRGLWPPCPGLRSGSPRHISAAHALSRRSVLRLRPSPARASLRPAPSAAGWTVPFHGRHPSAPRVPDAFPGPAPWSAEGRSRSPGQLAALAQGFPRITKVLSLGKVRRIRFFLPCRTSVGPARRRATRTSGVCPHHAVR